MKKIEVIFMPHPPVALPELQNGQGFRIEATLKGYEAMARRIAHCKPETIIYITPHGNSFSNGVCILDETSLEGNLGEFGHEEVASEKVVNRDLNQKIYECFEAHDMVSVLMGKAIAQNYGVKVKIDHGVLVPMYFIDRVYATYQIVHITPSGQDLLSHYKLGVYLKEVIADYDEQVLVVCSGDLSHALKEEGPYDFNAFGPVFDQKVLEAIQEKNPLPLLQLDGKEEAAAAQCGLRSFLMGFGLMDGQNYESGVASYEGPFGVGYLTGYLENDVLSVKPSLLIRLEEEARQVYLKRLESEDAYVQLARKAIEHYVKTHTKIPIDKKPTYMDEEIYEALRTQRAGAFVSIHEEGRLRGCIGTTEATAPSLLDEIIYCAISACSSDPRFNPIDTTELNRLEIKVDRLYEPQRIYDLGELDVIRYGVIVEQGPKRGLLLPNLEGVDSIEAQVQIAKEKAEITSEDDLIYYRFEVERHQ